MCPVLLLLCATTFGETGNGYVGWPPFTVMFRDQISAIKFHQ